MTRRIILGSSAIFALIVGSNLAIAQQSDQDQQILPPGQQRMHGTTGQSGQRKMPAQQQQRAGAAEEQQPMQPGAAPRAGSQRTQSAQQEQDQGTLPRKPRAGQATGTPANPSATANGEMNTGNANRQTTGTVQQNGQAAGQQMPSQSGTARNQIQEGETTGTIPRTGETQTRTNQNANVEQRNETATVQGRFQIDANRAGRIHDRLVSMGETERTNVNINVTVGAVLPQNVAPRELPAEIVTEFPQFRGYRYVVVHDEIVIVEPRTRQVVEIIGGPGGGTRHTATTSERLRLTAEQRDIIRRHVRTGSAGRIDFEARTNEPLPPTVRLSPMPEEVVRDVPMVQSYDFAVTNSDRVVIVDPQTREVIDVIE